MVTLYAPSLAYSNGNNGAEYYGDGPVHIVAGATSLDCVGGISAFVIYTADNQIGYESYSSYIDVQLPLTPAFYQMDIKAFDNCGGSSSVVLATYLQSSTGTVTVNQPEVNNVYTSPVVFNATSTTTCAKGVSAMGIYTANHQLAYVVNGDTLNTSLKLSPGTYNTVVEMWDNCNQAVVTPVTITVAPQHGIPQQPEYVYVPRTGSPWIDGFWVDPTSCALDTIPGSPFPAHYKPYGTAADPLGVYVFALNQDSMDINVYNIDPNRGGLTQVSTSPAKIPEYFPDAIAIDPSGRFVYVGAGNSGAPGWIYAFTLNRTTGTLTQVAGSPFPMKSDSTGPVTVNYLAVDANGKYLYTSNGSSVSGFQINTASGALSEMSSSPFTATGAKQAVAGTLDIILDPSHTHVYTANSESSISGWTVGSGGALTPIAGSPWTDPTLQSYQADDPESITIDSKGNYMFGLDDSASQISIWSVVASTGVVAFVRDEHQGQINLSSGLDKMRVAPNSSCLVDSQADALSFDTSTGVTTVVAGSPFALPGSGQQPGIAIAP